MYKKIIFTFTALLLFIPSISFADTVVSSPTPYDYRKGLLDDKKIILSTNFPDAVRDNNLSTYYGHTYHNGDLILKFKYPVDLKGYYLNSSIGYPNFYIKYFDDDNNIIEKLLPTGRVQGYYSINFNNVIEIRLVKTQQQGGTTIYEIDFFGEYIIDNTPPGDVQNLKAYTSNGAVELSYKFPSDDDFVYVNIYQDGVLIAEGVREEKYRVTGLKNDVQYEFKVTTVDTSGNESEGKTILATPNAEIEVKNVKVVASYNRVNLSWELPKTDNFSHVNIYRKTIHEPKLSFIMQSVAYADNNYEPLFETNGTYFNDLTVLPESTYDYKLTTTIENIESEGINVRVKTKSEPLPEMGGVDYFENENGDYVYKWTSPTKGQVKILVGGVEYATVPASNKQIVIPKADMKYTLLGNPDVRLIAISESGKEGKPINPNIPFSGVNLPLRLDDLLTTSMGILWILGPFILLVLAIDYSKKIIQLIRKSAENKMIRR